MNRRILIIEDDPLIVRMVRDNLVYEGFNVECVLTARGRSPLDPKLLSVSKDLMATFRRCEYFCHGLLSGDQALTAVRSFAPDLILLDLMLPGLDGFEICRAVSEGPTRVPIIILTARSQTEDKIRGMELGADDYITKPFVFKELVARIHAVIRRTNPPPEGLDFGDIHMDLIALRATKGKTPLEFTQREFEVLRLLWIHRNKVVTREQLIRSIWGYSEIPLSRPVDHFIARLRSKIESDPHKPRYLQTVYGEGYRLILED